MSVPKPIAVLVPSLAVLILGLAVLFADQSAVTLWFADALPTAAELDDAIEARLGPEDYFDDPHGTPRWRRHLTRLLARELLAELAA